MSKIWCFVLVMLVMLWPVSVLAQSEGINLVASPLPISLSTTPGNKVSTDLHIKNAGSKPEKLKVSLLKFKSDNSGTVKLLDKEPGDEFMDWVKFSEDTFSIDPNEWKTIKMNISTPKNAAYGYYYAVSFSRAKQDIARDKPTLVGQVITFVLLEVSVPGAKKSIKINSIESNKKVYEYLPVNFDIKVTNTGNVHVKPQGNIFIKRGSKIVGTLAINQGNGNVLPNSSRMFSVAWDDGFPVFKEKEDSQKAIIDKSGKTKKSLYWEFSKITRLRIGKYSAKIVVVYNDGIRDVPLQGEITFWVIPWKLMLLTITLLVAPALLVYLYMKRRQLKKSKWEI